MVFNTDYTGCTGWLGGGSCLTPAKAVKRLNEILQDKMLWFNPYWVDDEELVACAQRGYWRQFPAITQMVIFHFLDIRRVRWHMANYDVIFYRVGNLDTEYHLPLKYFAWTLTHHTANINLRSLMNGTKISSSVVNRLTNRSFFISHAIPVEIFFQPIKFAYNMRRLRGSIPQQAETIRKEMQASKILMLEEVLQYPTSPCYIGPCATKIEPGTK